MAEYEASGSPSKRKWRCEVFFAEALFRSSFVLQTEQMATLGQSTIDRSLNQSWYLGALVAGNPKAEQTEAKVAEIPGDME